MDREISPPPIKRRKLAPSEPPSQEDPPYAPEGGAEPGGMISSEIRYARIFTWNINGIQAFLPASNASITTFFKPVGKQDQHIHGQRPPEIVTGTGLTYRENPLRAFLRRHHWPEVLFLQELKISPSDRNTPPVFLSTINTSIDSKDALSSETRYTLDLNLPRDKHNARGFGGKLYGVGTLLREDFASQHVAETRHAAWDLEGRVTIVELRPRQRDNRLGTIGSAVHDTNPGQNIPLALINVYAVNGTNAAYRSPETGKPAGTRHDHKLAFHARLRDECLDLERRGFGIVVAGDLNIARGRLDGHPNLRTLPRQHCVNRADFNGKFFCDEDNVRAEAYLEEVAVHKMKSEPNFSGVDVFRALWGKERRYTYHPRGENDWGSSCDRVDFIIASKNVCGSGRVVKTDMLDSPQERGTSDHVPLWVEVKLA